MSLILLKECPSCTSDSSQILKELSASKWTIYCNSCGRNDAEVYGETKEDVVVNWNNLNKGDIK
jgi:hypothetical protein